MAKTTVFFSWQSDRNAATGQNLVERALQRAISRISQDINVSEPDRDKGRLELDRDTRNVAGSPLIMETILAKIDAAAVFIPDLTFVGARSDGRPTPNPNVLIEYGWALKAVGRARIIGVMNSAYGKPDGENLPFDLRHQKHPITYHCPKRANAAVKAQALDTLARALEEALRTVFNSKEYLAHLPGEIPTRLNRLLEKVNADRYQKVRPSHIAQLLGEERATDVEDWFLGKKVPTFAKLQAIADLYGINAPWLQHGDGQIYPIISEHLPRDSIEAAKLLLNWEGGNDALEVLHLIRQNDDEGSLYLVKKSRGNRYRIYHTSIHVSEVIGASGEADLMSLFVTLEIVYRRYTGDSNIRVVGHQMSSKDVRILMTGNANPGPYLNSGNDTWWEDIWDRKMSENDYWPGYHALRDRIERAITSSKYLSECRVNIRTGR